MAQLTHTGSPALIGTASTTHTGSRCSEWPSSTVPLCLPLVSEELRLGLEKDPAFAGMQRVALGTEEHNVRARLPALGLTVEQQVACLLDQATDPNLLGRVWGGWEPWV